MKDTDTEREALWSIVRRLERGYSPETCARELRALLAAAPQDASAPAVDALTTGAVGFRTRQPGFAWVPWLTDDQETIRKAIQDAIDHGAEGEALYANPAPSPKVPSVEQPLTDRVRALFQPWPEDELGPTDEPQSQYRFGYNTAIEDALGALQSAHTAGGQSEAKCDHIFAAFPLVGGDGSFHAKCTRCGKEDK